MTLWNNLKWLWSNELSNTVSCDTNDVVRDGIEARLNIRLDRLGKETADLVSKMKQHIENRFDAELSKMSHDVATAMSMANHCDPSVADILKENRTEHYTVRAIRLLNQNGIHTAKQLYGLSEKDLRRIKGLGRNTADYIMTTLFEQRGKYDR